MAAQQETGTLNGNISQILTVNQENISVPAYFSSFLKLGSAQYIPPQGSISDSSVANCEGGIQIQSLNTREPDKSNNSTEKSGIHENPRKSQNITDVWAYLKGVSHRFRSNLKQLLEDDLRGRDFLYSVCNVGKVDYSLISNLLVDSEVKDNPDKRIPRDLFLNWAHDLVLLIPSTNSEVWYRAYSGTSDGWQAPGGVLYQKYANRRKTYHKIGLLTSQKKRAVSADPEAIDINPPVAKVDDIRWLENNDEPRQNVIDKWIATQSYRLKVIESLGIEGYVQRFQALKRSDGYVLYDIDFDTTYPCCKDNMFTKWPRTAEGIIDFAKKSTSPEGLNFPHIHSALICEGQIQVLAFLILPLLLGSVRVKTTTANHKKPSRTEIADLFLLHAETLEDLQLRLQARTKRLMESKQLIQPFPILCGPISNLVSSRVMINAIEYNVCSPVKAIDSCFKSMFALNAKYQEGASHCWLFIEKYIYEFVEI